MAYTNSPLASLRHVSPNRSSPRERAIDRISIHCVVGQCFAETLGNVFAPVSKGASCNYGVGCDGEIILVVEEKDRSWCTSSPSNDSRAVTVEVASDTFEPYAVRTKAYEALLDLVTDICRRNGKTKLLWFGEKERSLAYVPKETEMVMTVHRWFENKSCPGAYLFERHGAIAEEVNRRLRGEPAQEVPPAPLPDTKHLYRVRRAWADAASQKGAFSVLENAKKCAKENHGYTVFDESGAAVFDPGFQPYTVRTVCDVLNIRNAPTTAGRITGQIRDKRLYTVTEEADGAGSEKGWGRLKSGAGWIALDWVTRAE